MIAYKVYCEYHFFLFFERKSLRISKVKFLTFGVECCSCVTGGRNLSSRYTTATFYPKRHLIVFNLIHRKYLRIKTNPNIV